MQSLGLFQEIIIFSLIGGLLSLTLAASLLINKKVAKRFASLGMPFAAGALLAAVFLDLLPEGVELGDPETMFIAALAGILLFFFASLISGLAQYIYYVYINPEYIKSQLSAAVTLLESLNMTSDPSLLEAVKTGLEQGNIPSPMAVVIQQMWVNVFFGSLLSAVMAWLVSVWFKSSKTKK